MKKILEDWKSPISKCASCSYLLIRQSYSDDLEPPKLLADCYYDKIATLEPKPVRNVYTIPKWCPLEDANE